VHRSRRTALAAGFGAVLVLQVFSTVEAYRIQSAVSEQHLEIYRRYTERDEALSHLRRNVLLGSNMARDFFLSTRPDRVRVAEAYLREMEGQNRDNLKRLENLEPPGRSHVNPRRLVEEYWRVLWAVPAMVDVAASSAYDFVQREISPRRVAVYTALRQLTEVYQAELQNREMQFARSRQSAARRLALVLVLCVVLGILVALFSLRHSGRLERQTIRQYDAVAQAKHELQELSARLLDIQEEERRRLSRGLHDEIGQTLTALRIEISNALGKAAAPEVRERLERARGLSERCVQTIRDIALVLRPALLDDLGLAPALQWQVEDFGRRSGMAADFRDCGVDEDLPDLLKTCVFRVLQEALNNCEKHSGATQVHVVLRQTPEAISLEVRDDGRGFAPGEPGAAVSAAGLGMLGMRERASRLGGTLKVDSAPGHGTRIVLEIPYAAAAGNVDGGPDAHSRSVSG